jgi:hypothetical protein
MIVEQKSIITVTVEIIEGEVPVVTVGNTPTVSSTIDIGNVPPGAGRHIQ